MFQDLNQIQETLKEVSLHELTSIGGSSQQVILTFEKTNFTKNKLSSDIKNSYQNPLRIPKKTLIVQNRVFEIFFFLIYPGDKNSHVEKVSIKKIAGPEKSPDF